MKSSIELAKEYYETGEATGMIAAVWRETQSTLNLVLNTEDPRLIGMIAGYAFSRRELYYDSPMMTGSLS